MVPRIGPIWTAHRWIAIAVVAVALLVATVGLIHTPFVRTRVLAWAVERLREDAGIAADIASLDYNLLALRASTGRLTLTAADRTSPFLTADGISIDIPWSIVSGRISMQSVEILRPTVTITRDADGRLNLPSTAAAAEPVPTASAPLGPIDIGRLLIRDLGIGYEDQMAGLSIDGRGVTLALERATSGPLAGRVSMSGGVTLRQGDLETSVSRLDGGLSFDGSALSLEALTVEAPEGQVRLDGRFDLLADAPRLDARYQGRAVLDRIVPWVAPEQALNGVLEFSGTAAGALDAPDVTVAVAGTDLVWRDQRAIAIDLRGEVSASSATIERAQVTIAGGTIDGRARIAMTDGDASRAELAWKGLDLGSLAQTAGVDQVLIAAIAGGGMTAEWTGSDFQNATTTINVTLDEGRPRPSALALAGRLSAALERGLWTLSLDGLSTPTLRVDGKAAGRLAADDVTASTLGGDVRVQIEELSALVDELRRAGLPLPADSPLAAGRASIQAVLSGTLGSPAASASLEASDLDIGGVRSGVLSANVAATPSRVAVEAFRLSFDPDTANGDLEIDLDTRTLRGSLNADLPRLSPLMVMVPPELRPEGAASLRADIGGTIDNPLVRLVASATGLEMVGQRIARLDLVARLADQVLDVERLDLAQDEGQLGITGRYALDSGRYAIDATGRRLTVRPVDTGEEPLPVSARFDVDLSGEGTIEVPEGRGTIAIQDLTWGAYDIGDGRLEAALAGNALRLNASLPALRATLAARAAVSAPRRFTADIDISEAQLDALIAARGPGGADAAAEPPSLPFPLSGAVTASAKASGDLDRPQDAIVDLDLRLVDVAVAGTPVLLARPARLRYEGGLVTAEDFTLAVGGATLTALGQFGNAADATGLTVSLKGGLVDFLPFARLAQGFEHVEATGAIDMIVHASGTLDAPRVDATLTLAQASASIPDRPAVTNLNVRASFDEGLLTLSEVGAEWQGATVNATGTVPITIVGDGLPERYTRTLGALPDRARAAIRLDSVTAAVAAPFVDEATLAQLGANFAATMTLDTVSLDLEALNADVTLDRAELSMAGMPLTQERPTKLRVAGGRLDVVDWAWSGGGNRVTVSGGAAIAGENPEMQVALGGSLDLRLLGVVSSDLGAAGRADFDIRATGPLQEPAFEGQLRVQEGELAIRDPRIAVTDLRGTVALLSDRLRLIDVVASANGGTLQASGEIVLDGFMPAGGDITLIGRGLALEIPENLRSEVDLDLTFVVSDDAPALTGRVTLLRGSYREPISLTGQLLSGVEIEPAVPSEPGLLDRIRLSVSVVSEDGIAIDNNYARLEIESDLKVVGTPAQPALAGRLTIAEGGAVFLAGQRWTVERGTVDFTSATSIEPNLDLALVTRVQRYEVRLSVSGTPDTLEATLTSPDGLSQADAVSLLLTGRPADPGSSMAQTEIARGQLLLLLSGELLGFAGRAVGLDSAQVSRGLGGAASDFDLLATDTDPSARLTLAKQIRRDVEVIFSQSLRTSDDLVWIAAYRPTRSIELRATTNTDNSRSYAFRNELNFGGGVTRRATGSRRVAPRISAVRFTGMLGFDESDVRGRVKLGEGDRFDFYRWQQDRDRLDDFYRERGFLEARIRASRDTIAAPGGEPSIVLTYAIERGPATSLAIEGVTLPGDVVEAMEEAWARAVFDGFLREDLEELAKQSLAEDGFLRAEAQVDIREDAQAGTKQIAVRLTPGTRYTDRRLAFSGQEFLTARELEAIFGARRFTQTAWLRPADVEAAIVALYRSRGVQSARVSIAPPVFTETSATLPIEVDEGPQFRIASVDIEGVSARPLAEVRQAFGLEAGDPYVPLALVAGRRDVQISYLRQGYNDVRVTVSSVADPDDPSTHITLRVQEGTQQVLEDVSLTGANITTAGTVRRALNLTTGEPANVSDTYRAQKRLYDTGVFQRADVVLEPTGDVRTEGREPVRAVVSVEELAPYRLRYGVRLTDDTGPLEADREIRPGIVIDVLRRNLFGRAIAAGAAGQLEKDERLARGILSMPYFFGLPVTTSLFLTQSRQDFAQAGFTPFVEDTSEVTTEQRFRPQAKMAVSYSYRFKRTHAFETSPTPGLPAIDFEVNVARLTGTYAWDTRDDPFNARRGWFHSSGIEYAAAALGSELRFIKYIAQQFYFKEVGRQVVLASAFRLGAARGFGQGIIPSERFLLGGGTSIRGFAENGLGELDLLGEPAGGSASIILNQEVRFPIYRWVRGVGFLDAGNVFPRIRSLSLLDLEAGAGFGVRIDTPFGLARVDFGMPLTTRAREPFGRWYFSLGQAF